jgi:hypothetical protein
MPLLRFNEDGIRRGAAASSDMMMVPSSCRFECGVCFHAVVTPLSRRCSRSAAPKRESRYDRENNPGTC